ncbi:putative bifunctional diguanylate cyclase/phosphodiesterase [Sphingomonas pituitosa]|uniref:putative bifunctional diguanylate cyclase/phosphodiesterase n=1 Tax=Sphingomonas pituitosa TaxID=99597 RepID=UPI000835C3F5|nr:GGDEF and EAL domain-containing protein [Sphingomonas pituitosa]
MQNYREAARLDALHQLKLLDTPPSAHFDRITRMAAQIFGLPVAAVSLTDRDRQWFKSRVGIDHCSIPREKAPCAEVAELRGVVVIEDFATHPCYADSLLAHNGTRFYAGAPLVTSDGYGLGALCVLGTEPRVATADELAALGDLAAMVMAQIELQHAFGRIDPISGLPTRAQFRDDLADLARDHPGQSRIAVVADLARDDQIAKIVGVVGAGRLDEMVREASRAIQGALGADRTAYHVGTTQFAFFSPPDIDVQAYVDVLEQGFAAIRATSSARFVTSVAIGLRPFRLGEVSPEDVLRGAASAAQDARRNDGAIAVYSPARDSEMRRRYDLLQDFGAALEAGDQLRLVYQPRVDLGSGRCVGAETLLRWRHPALGEVSPAEFIPIIEQTALARPVTQWVLEHALDQLAAWQPAGLNLTLSINISAANLMETDLIQRIQLALLARQLRAEQLEIELTESAMMAQPEKALAMLRELSAAGIALAIDDFGTGHSSLAYLQQVPAHVVKIDQAFVRELSGAWGADYVLVETMVGLIHKLGRRVVVEGVETEAAATLLAGMGCEEAQGYWFARPLEPGAFVEWIAARKALAA